MKIIAEVGSTWKRDTESASFEAALESIRAAKFAGADIVKFQLFRAAELYSRDRAPKQYAAVRDYELSYDWLKPLEDEAHAAGLKIWHSCFSWQALEQAGPWADGLKLASGDLVDLSLVQSLAECCQEYGNRPVISTGVTTKSEVARAVAVLREYGLEPVVLNCVSKYPAEPADYNLVWPKHAAGHIGLSDHTLTSALAMMAVAAGYEYTEKHFCLPDTPMANPDRAISLEPAAFTHYVKSVRLAERLTELVTDRPQTDGAEWRWMRRGSDGLRPMEVDDAKD